jgi:hypothetical protein
MSRAAGPSDVVRRLAVGELGWDDLIVAPAVSDRLRVLVERAALGGLTVAIHGPAGVGKTFAVRVWAEAMRLDLWAVDCPALVERHGPRAATRGLREALAVGERPHAVLLFHDAAALPADALAPLLDRGEGRRAPTVLETREALGIALPAEVARVELPLPDVSLRRRHWEALVGRASPLSRPDVEALAALEAPGAVIDAAVRQVVLAAGDERLETDALLAAARRVLADVPPP